MRTIQSLKRVIKWFLLNLRKSQMNCFRHIESQLRKNKIESWMKSIHILSDVALKQPQAAYVAVSKSLQNEWSYMQRVFPDCEELFSPLCQSLMNEFFPALTGNPINEQEYNILEKPIRMAGLRIRDPVASA